MSQGRQEEGGGLGLSDAEEELRLKTFYNEVGYRMKFLDSNFLKTSEAVVEQNFGKLKGILNRPISKNDDKTRAKKRENISKRRPMTAASRKITIKDL